MTTANEITMASKSINNIKRNLRRTLETKYGIQDEQATMDILRIHGLHPDNFDIMKNIETLLGEKLNDVSIDDNSNKNEKTIEGLQQEAFAPYKKLVGYDYLYRKMKDMYGRDEAKRLTGELFDFSLGLSDSTHILKPYCWAMNASALILEGRQFGQLHSRPAKKVKSYISSLCETVHQMSSHLAGAIAVSTFFLDITHLLLYKEKVDLWELRRNPSKRKEVEDEFQQFVHSVNHLSRNGCESPFTNVSVFDKPKLKTLIEDLEHFFPFMELPIVHPADDSFESPTAKKEFYLNYIAEYVSEVQDIYLEFFNKGDPCKGGLPYRFPVTTINLAKSDKQEYYEIELDGGVELMKVKKGKGVVVHKTDEVAGIETIDIETLFQTKDHRAFYIKDETGVDRHIKNVFKRQGADIVDGAFLKKVCKLDIYRYNIFVSAGTKIASCCLSPESKIIVKHTKTKIVQQMTIKEFVQLTGGEEVTEKKISGWTILSYTPMVVGTAFPDSEVVEITGVLQKKNEYGYLIKLRVDGRTIQVTPDHVFSVFDNIEKEKKEITALDIYTEKECSRYKIPVSLDGHPTESHYADLHFREKVDYDGMVYDIELEKNHYFSANGIISHNCRLLSDKDMLDVASQTNSFGGSGISLGSHRVCTINFMRIAIEATDKDDFYKRLDERIESSAKILKAHKTLIKDLADANLQQFISLGWISLNRMFSTFGILGIYEAAIEMKQKFGNGYDIEGEILRYINNKIKELASKYGLIFNIEQIPGESFAVRLAQTDKMLFGEEKVPYKLYANQFIPLWETATMWEKMSADGKYNALITGGGIVHAQIGEKITAKQAEKVIRYAVNSGCEHFALNAVYSICENSHTIFGKAEVCPICSGKIVDMLTRIVGFFTPVSSWNKTRREWEFPRRTFVDFSKEKEA